MLKVALARDTDEEDEGGQTVVAPFYPLKTDPSVTNRQRRFQCPTHFLVGLKIHFKFSALTNLTTSSFIHGHSVSPC